MIVALGNILFIIFYVAVCCFIAYKVFVYAIDKISHLIMTSKIFRICLFLTLAIFFLATGIFQLFDYYEGKYLKLTRYFPLTLALSGVMVYCAILAFYKDPEKMDL